MFDRQIRRRVSKIAPFLLFDDDPYPGRRATAASSGSRTPTPTTDRYPYSTDGAARRELHPQLGEGRDRRLQRHGRRSTWPSRTIRSRRRWQSVFPALLKPLSEMPAGLRAHVRYPEGIFRSAGVGLRHVSHDQPGGLLQQGRPVGGAGHRPAAARPMRMEPYYTMMKLPGEIDGRVHPDAALHAAAARQPRVVDGGAQRRRALRQAAWSSSSRSRRWCSARTRWSARINQDQVISPQITLWNQQGSEVIQGTLMVIPIEESLIYVRPLYLRAQAGRIPELTRVIVAYQNRIVMERTLDAAITQLFGATRPGTRRAPRPRPPQPAGSRRPAPRRPPSAVRRPWRSCRPRPRQTYERAARRAARRRLGELRRGDQAPRRDPRADETVKAAPSEP